MKAIFGVLSLLVVVAIVGLLAKKQLGAAGGSAQPSAAATAAGVVVPTGTPRDQVQQVQKTVEGVMQQARPMPDEPK